MFEGLNCTATKTWFITMYNIFFILDESHKSKEQYIVSAVIQEQVYCCWSKCILILYYDL